MGRPVLAFLVIVALGACADDSASSSGSTTEPHPDCEVNAGVVNTTLTAGGATHEVRIFIPSAAIGGTVLPTVLNWHGLSSTGAEQASYSEYETLAEQEGFIAVHPTGSEHPGLPVLEQGVGWELFDVLDSAEHDDLAFANALIDELIANWCTDVNRIFSIGLSNGGFFTSAIVCELSDRLAGAGSVAGLYHADSCVPSHPVPYIAFHGVDDRVVPYETGGPTEFPELRDSIFALGAFDAFAAFAVQFGCDPEPTATDIGTDVTRFDYVNCDNATPMTFYSFDNVAIGHSWPGSVNEAVTTDDVNATLASWQFFEPLTRGQG